MTIEPLADIIIYTEERGSRAVRLLGGSQAGLGCLTKRYGPLAHGTTAEISGADDYLNAEFEALDATGLHLKFLG